MIDLIQNVKYRTLYIRNRYQYELTSEVARIKKRKHVFDIKSFEKYITLLVQMTLVHKTIEQRKKCVFN